MNENFVMQSPVGNLYVATQDDSIIALEYNTRKQPKLTPLSSKQSKIKKSIQRYFSSDDPHEFNFNLELTGSEFQKRVWSLLQRIPLGQVKTYGELASQLKSSARAVGNACRANPIPLIVPCHRVVAKGGIGGFSGKRHGLTIKRKRWLLAHEGVTI